MFLWPASTWKQLFLRFCIGLIYVQDWYLCWYQKLFSSSVSQKFSMLMALEAVTACNFAYNGAEHFFLCVFRYDEKYSFTIVHETCKKKSPCGPLTIPQQNATILALCLPPWCIISLSLHKPLSLNHG